MRFVPIVVLGLLLSGPLAAEDWPQFRGPGGLAVSADTGLPVDFSPDSTDLKWKAPIRGTGISSPVISGGRVFLTTAYQGEERSRTRGTVVSILGALAALALVGCAGSGLRRRAGGTRDEAPAPGWYRALGGLDAAAVALTTLGFLVAAFAAVLAPRLLWTPGVPGDVWIITSGVGLAGLVAAFGWFRPSSVARLVGVAVLAGAAWYVFRNVPLNKHLEPYALPIRLGMTAPALAGGAWFLLLYLVRPRGLGRLGIPEIVACGALAAVAALHFTSSNFLSPRAGLMRAALCLDSETGELLWDTPLFVAPEERLHRENSFATPSPCTDGEYVLTFFGAGLACLDFEGRVLWSEEDEGYAEYARYGSASSPICYEDTFIVLQESEQNRRPSYMMALDKRTGERRWRIEPGYAHDSYMTPLLMPLRGITQLITVTYGQVVAYDPETGKRWWSLKLPIQQMVPGLCFEDDLLLVSGGAHAKFATAGVRLSGAGRKARPELLWQTTRAVPNTPSPVLYDGCFFTVTSNGGIMTCFEPETGAEHWKERLGGTFLSSLVAGDGKVYACTAEGEVVVIEAGAEFNVVSRTELGEPIHATPAISDGCVFIRSEGNLYCFESREDD